MSEPFYMTDGRDMKPEEDETTLTDWDWWFSKTAIEQLELIKLMRSPSKEKDGSR